MDALNPPHQVFIYCRGGERRAQNDPAWDKTFVTWGAQPLVDEPSAVDIDDFSRWLTERKIECVFFNEQRSWLPVILCAERKILTGAFVVHYREDTVPLFHCYDFLICNSQHHFEVMSDHPQVRFVRWGTDLTRFRPSAPGIVTPGCVTFFHSGGLNPHRKGTDLVLQGFAKLRPGRALARLVLHTQADPDESLRTVLDALQASAQGSSIDLFRETVPDLADLYRLGDVCVYPTRHEGLGLTVAESLASGLPILVTEQPPVSEHADGKVIRPVAVEIRYARPDGDYWPQSLASVDSLAAQMQAFVDNPEDLSLLKEQARETAVRLFDWKKNAADLPQFFSGLKLIESQRKTSALAAAREFERRKSHQGLRNWVGIHFPWLIRSARILRATKALGRALGAPRARDSQGHPSRTRGGA